MSRPKGLVLVGRDGELELYADEKREVGILYDVLDDTQSKRQPLQVFFKWGNFEPVENTNA